MKKVRCIITASVALLALVVIAILYTALLPVYFTGGVVCGLLGIKNIRPAEPLLDALTALSNRIRKKL